MGRSGAHPCALPSELDGSGLGPWSPVSGLPAVVGDSEDVDRVVSDEVGEAAYALAPRLRQIWGPVRLSLAKALPAQGQRRLRQRSGPRGWDGGARTNEPPPRAQRTPLARTEHGSSPGQFMVDAAANASLGRRTGRGKHQASRARPGLRRALFGSAPRPKDRHRAGTSWGGDRVTTSGSPTPSMWSSHDGSALPSSPRDPHLWQVNPGPFPTSTFVCRTPSELLVCCHRCPSLPPRSRPVGSRLRGEVGRHGFSPPVPDPLGHVWVTPWYPRGYAGRCSIAPHNPRSRSSNGAACPPGAGAAD